ncbi:MAG TPA: hypothetical protein VKK30_02850 [Actinomycetota bacterium]|nr:hypothetical protein [Actinomycetota bacterium]
MAIATGAWALFLSPGPGKRVAPPPTPGEPLNWASGAAIGEGSLWVLTCSARCTGEAKGAEAHLLRFDLGTGRELAKIPVSNPQAIAVGEGAVWVIDFWDDEVLRVDPGSNRVEATIKLVLNFAFAPGDHAFLPFAITAGEGAVWVDTERGAVARIDPTTNRVTAVIRVKSKAASGLAAGEGAVWVTGDLAGVARIDPRTNKASATIPGGTCRHGLSLEQIVAGAGAVWALGAKSTGETGGGTLPPCISTIASGLALVRIDPATNRVVATISLLQGAVILGMGIVGPERGVVWVSDGTDVWSVDPATNRISRPTPCPARSVLAVGPNGTLWVLDSGGRLSQFQTLRPSEGRLRAVSGRGRNSIDGGGSLPLDGGRRSAHPPTEESTST